MRMASASVTLASVSPFCSWVWKANSPLPSTAGMKQRRSGLNATFIHAGRCGTTR